jgi:LmbE family N-acetylglucosaminyl deacetylase
MKILFFCAHPDDLEFFIGNFMTVLNDKYLRQEYVRYITNQPIGTGNPYFDQIEVSVVSMTRGEMSDFTDKVRSTKTAATIRTYELRSSLGYLGISPPDFLGYMDGFLRISEKTIENVKKYLIQIAPDIIVAPEPIFTWYHHPDHTRTGKIVYRAICRMIQEQKTIHSTVKIPSLYYYGALQNQFYFPFVPSLQHRLKKAVQSHASQALLLIIAKIPSIISSFFHGRKVVGSRMAEALRRQYLPGKDNPKFKDQFYPHLSPLLRILWYFAISITGPGLIDYSKRLQFYDGTL